MRVTWWWNQSSIKRWWCYTGPFDSTRFSVLRRPRQCKDPRTPPIKDAPASRLPTNSLRGDKCVVGRGMFANKYIKLYKLKFVKFLMPLTKAFSFWTKTCASLGTPVRSLEPRSRYLARGRGTEPREPKEARGSCQTPDLHPIGAGGNKITSAWHYNALVCGRKVLRGTKHFTLGVRAWRPLLSALRTVSSRLRLWMSEVFYRAKKNWH